MKKRTSLLLLCLFLIGCVSEFQPEKIAGSKKILVVEGTITDGESQIRLSHSVSILDTLQGDHWISDAIVSIECSDGTIFDAFPKGNGIYRIKNGTLNNTLKYRLNFRINQERYQSDFLTPIRTPEIDSLSFHKAMQGEPLSIHVTTHTNNAPAYFRWSYQENWEVQAQLYANAGYIDGQLIPFNLNTPYNTYYCWGRDSSKTLLLGSTEGLAENLIPQKKLYEIPCDHDKLSSIYHVEVEQTQLREEAYLYFKRLQDEIERTGGIFSSVLSSSENNGNVRCLENPDLPVIGFVEVASITRKSTYLYNRDHDYYEPRLRECPKYPYIYHQDLPWLDYLSEIKLVSYPDCVDCRKLYNATKTKPSWWPTDHL